MTTVAILLALIAGAVVELCFSLRREMEGY